MTSERQFLESELIEINRILENIPQENVIDRATFHYRRDNIEKQLKKLPIVPESEIMTITFRGDPVRGTHGIFVDFTSKIMNALSDAYAALVAVAKGIPAGMAGAIPEIDKHKLLITGTATGSFGFTLELPKADDLQEQLSLLSEDENPLVTARTLLEDVLSKALEADDEQLADSVETAGSRAFEKIRDFYEILQDNNATFTLKTGRRQIGNHNIDLVRYAASRLKSDNIIEQEQVVKGKFTGILPIKRDFEFVTETNELLRGKIGNTLDHIETLFTDYNNKAISLKLNTRKFGKGKPRYTLVDREHISVIS